MIPIHVPQGVHTAHSSRQASRVDNPLPFQRHLEAPIMYYLKRIPEFRTTQRNELQVPLPAKARRAHLVPLAQPQPIAQKSPSFDQSARSTQSFWHSESVNDEHVAMPACYEDHLKRIRMSSVFAYLRGDDPLYIQS